VDLAKDPNTGPLARSTTPKLKRDKALDPWTMPRMTFKTDIGAVDILCALIRKMTLHINAAEAGRHPDNFFVARQTCCSIFGDKQIQRGEEVLVPGLSFFDRDAWVCCSFLGLSHVFVAVAVAMQACDVFVRRLRAFFVDAVMTFETVCVRCQNRLLSGDLPQSISAIRPMLAERLRNQMTAGSNQPAAQNNQSKGDGLQMACVTQ
jgi:hypothetical protein